MVSESKSVVIGFTESYRDKHWRPCRFAIDPRKCKCYICICSLAVAREKAIANGCGCYARRLDETPICLKDYKPCDARWEE